MKERLRLIEIVSQIENFVNYIKTAKGYSKNTLEGYATDLCQAFELEGRIINTGGKYRFKHAGSGFKPEINLEPTGLYKKVMSAQTRWVKLKEATRCRKSSSLKSFLKHLFDHGIINTNLAIRVDMPKIPYKIPQHLTKTEMMKIIRKLKKTSLKDESRLEDYIIILTIYACGLRVSELCSLTWDSVSITEETLTVIGKGNKERCIPFPRVLTNLFIKIGEKSGYSGPLFKGSIDRKNVWRIVRRAASDAKIRKKISPHAIRHSYATHIVQGGGNILSLQKLMGHSSINSTQRYTHLNLSDMKQTVENCHPLSELKGEKKRGGGYV